MRWLMVLLCSGFCDATEPPAAPAPPGATTIPLQPATTPRPALKYHLLPERYGLIPGNAALLYHRANVLLVDRRRSEQPQPGSTTGDPATTLEERVNGWVNKPIAELPRDEVRDALSRFATIIKEIETGARRDHCDWELAHRDEGVNLLLPEIQNMRALARLIELQAKLAIADGQLDRAFASIQTHLVLGRHVAEAPFLIATLIGNQIDLSMIRYLELLVGTPGAPSLFWALADRPRPMIDLRSASETERHLIEVEFPELLELDRGIWGPDQTRRFVESLQAKLPGLIGGENIPGLNVPVPPGASATTRRLLVAAMCAKIEPEARRSLILGGRPEAEVNAMPVVQVAALYSFERFKELSDENFKWVNVPYTLAAAGDRREALSPEEKRANPLLALMATFTVDFKASRLAALRVDRQLDALQVVEAIRLDASRNDGRFPSSLDAIKDLPIPLDILTGKPFRYQVEGSSATLSGPAPVGMVGNPANMIELKLVLPKH